MPIDRSQFCILTDQNVLVSVSGAGALNALRADPYLYQSGFRCSNEQACREKKINCQVFKETGEFPFSDEQLLEVNTTVRNYRDELLARAATYAALPVRQLIDRAERTRGINERLELVWMLRFYTGPIENAWRALKVFFDPSRIKDPDGGFDAACEAYISVAYWAERGKIPGTIKAAVVKAVRAMRRHIEETKDESANAAVIRESAEPLLKKLGAD